MGHEEDESTGANEQEYNMLKRKRATAKGKLTRKLTLFKEGVNRKDHISVLKTNYESVLVAYQSLESLNDELINYACEKNMAEELVEEAQQYILASEREKNEVHATIFRLEKEKSYLNKPKVKVKAFEPPKFHGNMRDYPNFKEDFKKLVFGVYGPDPYALKMCLSGEALQAVKGTEDNYDEMFKRLDDKFGNARKIVDLVIGDLKSLRKLSDGDMKAFIKMVEQVEQCWLDLKKVNLSDELNTANVVSHIEKVLPSIQKREWVIIAEEVSTTNQLFPELLKFLQKEKRVLEYMNSSLRSGSSDNKLSVNKISSVTDDNTDSELLKLVKKMGDEQQEKNKEFESCIVNLTEMVKNANLKTDKSNVGCWIHNSANHDITECYKFKVLGIKDRFELVKRDGICFKCLKGYHAARNCKTGKVCDIFTDGKGLCNQNHHPMLHYEQREGTSHNAVSVKTTRTLLNISTAYSKNQPLTVLWDPGSDVSLITHIMAKKLGLQGKTINISMIKVGNVIEHQISKEYSLPLSDKTGNLWHIDAVGISEISAKIEKCDLSKIPELFLGILDSEVERPHGEIDLLIGSNYSELLPRVVQTNKGFQLLENQFGLSVRGRHDEITGSFHSNNHIVVRTHKLSSSMKLNEVSIEPMDSLKTKLDQFFTVEESGIKCNPQCVNCRCRGCPNPDSVNLKEEKELKLIEEGLVYDEQQKCWTITYPWVKDPTCLKNNIKVAMARLKTTENRLKKLDTEYAKKYQGELEDMISRGVARKLSDEEIKEYKGPVHYLCHHEVLKPDSISTPVRIVFNSSASYMAQKLNDFGAKGPDMINSLLGILFRFRQERIVIAGDISKMYHTVKLSLLDQHTHRFVWRDLDNNRPPDHYVLTSVTFGDRPSGTIAIVALRRTVDKFGSEFPEVQDMIVNNTYVDDILYSVDSPEKVFELIQNVEHILSFGNFKVKYWVASGYNEDQSINLVDSNCEKILGIKWNPKKDYFFFEVSINFSPRVKKIRTGPNLRLNNLGEEFPLILTRRMVLSQIASLYDPLGFVVPVLLKAKLLMRSMITKCDSKDEGIKWDDPLDNTMRREWRMFFTDLYGLEHLTFKRSLKPSNAVGEPCLIVFSDGSMQAYGACAYVRWVTDDGKFISSLIVAKSKIAPVRQLSIPRLELCGALVAARLRDTIVKEFQWEFKSVFHLVDSSIVRAQVQKQFHGFKTFVAVRIAEIQAITDPNEWYWIETGQNVADFTSRPCTPDKIDINSTWQNGPRFLTQPISEWPIKKCSEEQITDRIGVAMMSINDQRQLHLRVINVDRFSHYYRLLRTTCRVNVVFQYKSFKGLLREPTSEDIQEAELMWVREMQKDMSDWEIRFKSLGPTIENGIIFVGQRISKWLKDFNCCIGGRSVSLA